MATTPLFLPGKSHRQRSLADYSPWGRIESERRSDFFTVFLIRRVNEGVLGQDV